MSQGNESEPNHPLLDSYEESATMEGLKPVFDELATALVSLLDRIRGCSSASVPGSAPS